MKTLTLDNFKGGMDRRKRLSEKTPAFRLVKDAVILSNGDVGLRNYFRHCVSLMAGNGSYKGLYASQGALHTFYWYPGDFSEIQHEYLIPQPSGVAIKLYVHPLTAPHGTTIDRIVFCREVSGYLYVVARVTGNARDYLHFWLVDDAPKWSAKITLHDGDQINPSTGFNGWRYTVSLDGTTPDPWIAMHSYTLADEVTPSTPNGFYYTLESFNERDNDPAPPPPQPPAPPPAPPPGGGGGGGGRFPPPGGGGGTEQQ